MTQFDMLLRRALMDANLAQYGRVIQKAEAQELDASPRYYRERMRLLADPWDWTKQRAGIRGKRLDWRLIAIVAALLLLSACAVAVATGQFTQWFPYMGVNPEAPDQSEEVLTRMGTVIQQSQTVGDTTVTLNAAVWDGEYVWLSFTIESPSLPEDLQAYTPLHTGDCRLILRQDQWEEYQRNRTIESCSSENMTPEEVEEAVRAALAKENRIGMWLAGAAEREGNVLTFEDNESLLARWFTETTRPELTLHLENIATYADGKGESVIDENGYAQNPGPGEIVIPGPFDLTFTLNEPIQPIYYGGANVEKTVRDIPPRFNRFGVSVLGISVRYNVLNAPEVPDPPDPTAMAAYYAAVQEGLVAAREAVRGFWTEDGAYVDIMGRGGRGSESYAEIACPYPIDPSTVTAVDIAGERVELRGLEILSEQKFLEICE